MFEKFIVQFAGVEPLWKSMDSPKFEKQHKIEILRGYMKRFNEVVLQVVNYNDQVAISYFIRNVHKEKPYYYLVKLEKLDKLVEIMKTIKKFALIKDGEDEEDQDF